MGSGMKDKEKVTFGISYFEQEGRHNLPEVLSRVKSAFGKREDIRACKIVIFTALGEGPALAYNKLKEYDPKIIAVTFPPGYSVKRTNEEGHVIETPIYISEKLRKFFDGVGVTVLSAKLPFDGFEGAESITQQLKLIKDVLTLFAGGFSLCVQAVLQACDMGAVNIGEKVVAITGDCAALVTASNSAKFLSYESGLSINEILCKPRNFTRTRKPPQQVVKTSGELFPTEREIKLLPPT
jgi:hypothetical protein